MFFTGSFSRAVDMLNNTMDVSILRRNVMANNIANSDTPNFKRTDVNFEAELKRALESGNIRPFPANLTREKHISFQRPQNWRDVKPRRVLDYLTTAKNNGNNVDIEVEMMGMLENQLMYQTMSQMITSEFNRVNLVLR
ncbi:MAG: flagellar basal body rod protein FlgB [Spirochaetales bacterium]|nr:flagellar basal body rod protein FlgB [Spirochaetales bacterium]